MPVKDSKKKVILIDDNHSDGVIIKRYLEPDHVFQHILDENIIIQEINKTPPDCILIDYHLVKFSGLEILTTLTKFNFGKPIAYIILTGQGNLDIAMKSMKTGAHDFITKDDLTKDSLTKSIRLATKNAESEYQVKYLAYHDPLTYLWNRQAFWQQLETQIEQANYNKELFAVIYMDLDKFKLINDTYGHNIGDKLLVQVAKRLLNNIKEGDIAARLGGDEFILLLKNIKKYANAEKAGHRLRSALSKPIRIENKLLDITASMGISIFPINGRDPDKLINNSDIAMYKAKRSGRNEFEFFDRSINK